jgi:phosphoribosylaminoimidazolecarboxamide formyltransferase / IMP cyclohydrolase
VASSVAEAPALARAAAAGVQSATFARSDYGERAERDEALAGWIAEQGARLVVLAGYMELLGESFLARFPGAVINVHPSLLPAFPGLHAIEQALDYGVKVFGVTVHFVDGGVDTGPVIAQRALELPGVRDAEAIREALRPLEHELLSEAVRLFARGALQPDRENPRRIAAGAGGGYALSMSTDQELASAEDEVARAEDAATSGPRPRVLGERAHGAAAGGEIGPAAPAEVRLRRALLSVSDKDGIVDFARGLSQLGVEIISTGGTARELTAAGLGVRTVEDFTGFPEIMDGRVKTLHPRLYGGLLARRDDEAHLRAAAEQGIEQVDLVCVNLYPFEQTVAREGVSEAEAIENIDIGGPTMIRAAAKNHAFAAVLVDPADYPEVLAELRGSGGEAPLTLSLATRKRLAGKAFACTARYDAAISTWFSSREHDGFGPSRREAYEKVSDLRYGENPHQSAAFYARAGAPTHLLDGVRQLHGKELSFNNLLDLSSARELLEDLEGAACVIVKHNNPCGCAVADSGQRAYERAFACDPQSAYGGVIAVNRRVDSAFAEALSHQFIEVLLAPGFDTDALEVLTQKKNVRLLELADWPSPSREVEGKPVLGGQLVQTRDVVSETREQMRVMGRKAPAEAQWDDLLFAWKVCRHVRSNAIVIAAGGATIGIGAGQMSRVDAVRIAIEKAQAAQPELLAGSSLASDAYFPFADGPQLAIDAGVGAIIQPGGSVRDDEVVAAADAGSVAMVATDRRHFRH